MTRQEFIETCTHLKFTLYAQVRNFVEALTPVARRMKQYLLAGQMPIAAKIQEALKWIKSGEDAQVEDTPLIDMLCAKHDEAPGT